MSDLEARLQDNSFLGGRRVWLTDDALSVEEFQSLQELEAVSITLVVPEEPVEPEVAVEEKVVVEEPAVEEPPAETFDFDPNDFSPTYGQGPVGVQPVESREPVVEETPESESVYDDVRDYLKEELGISRVDGINPERIMQVEQAISIAVVDIGQAIADGRFDERYYEDVIDYVAGFDEGQQDEMQYAPILRDLIDGEAFDRGALEAAGGARRVEASMAAARAAVEARRFAGEDVETRRELREPREQTLLEPVDLNAAQFEGEPYPIGGDVREWLHEKHGVVIPELADGATHIDRDFDKQVARAADTLRYRIADGVIDPAAREDIVGALEQFDEGYGDASFSAHINGFFEAGFARGEEALSASDSEMSAIRAKRIEVILNPEQPVIQAPATEPVQSTNP